MSERVPLSFLLVEKGSDLEPVVPFAAFRDEIPCIVTAVLERTAAIHAVGDRYDTGAIRHDRIFVDPDTILWQVSAGARGSENGQGRLRRWNGARGPEPMTAAELQASREVSEKRALKNQAEVARAAEAQKKADRERVQREAVTADISKAVDTPQVEHLCACGCGLPAAPTKEYRPEHKPSKSALVVMKYCPGCKQEKPRSGFPPGKGFFKCAECRAPKASPYMQAVGRNLDLVPLGQKHCPRCSKDKAVEEFNRNRTTGDGLQKICRACQRDTYTIRATEHRGLIEGTDEGPAVEPSAPSRKVELKPVSVTVTGSHEELLDRLKRLRQERDDARTERDEARAELARVYADIQEALAEA